MTDKCPACGREAHKFMRLERVIACGFNGMCKFGELLGKIEK